MIGAMIVYRPGLLMYYRVARAMSKTTASRLVSAPLLTALLLVTAIQPAQAEGSRARNAARRSSERRCSSKAEFDPSDVTGSACSINRATGLIMTNAHVVPPGQADPKIETHVYSGLSSERTVFGRSLWPRMQKADLAISR